MIRIPIRPEKKHFATEKMYFSLIDLFVNELKAFHREPKINVICGISIRKYRENLVEQKIDIDRLREDILDYYGTAMFNDFAMAAMNVQFIEMASDQDLIAIAQKEGVDLTKYIE